MILRDHKNSENFLKRKSPDALHAAQEEEVDSQNSMHQIKQRAAWRMLP
jgi:hypothetical protein